MPSRYFLAPLAAYTDLAFRRAVRELGGLGLATTDLVQATLLLSGTRRSLELIATTPDDRPLSVQIYGGKVDELVRAARWLQDHGYEGVDINMGCPVARINSQGGGARLMCDREGAVRAVAAVVDAVRVPVTVKMRLGWDDDQITAPELARRFEQVGVAAVTVHGRTRQQGFSGSVRLDGIRAVVEAVERMPVVGNGDVRTVEDAFRMRLVTGCQAVAIGRGALLDPWIFRKIEQAERGERPTEPSPDEQLAFLVRHFTLLTEQHRRYACVLFRKYAAWYGARLGIPEDLEDQLRRLESYEQFDRLVEQIRRRHGERRSAVPTALQRLSPPGPTDRW